jgi:hypothetical protein
MGIVASPLVNEKIQSGEIRLHDTLQSIVNVRFPTWVDL